MKTLLKNARILSMVDENITFGHVIVNNNIIEDIVTSLPDEKAFDKVVDCKNNLLMPGFKNAHAHSAMTFLRSVADDSNLHDWLFNEIFPREENLHDGCIGELTKVAILEYLTSGITACSDMYFYLEEFKNACDTIGFRSTSIGLFNSKSRPAEYIKNCYFNWKKTGVSDLAVGMHSEYTATDDMYENTKNLLKETGSKFYVHLCETYDEVKGCYDRHGVSPVQWFNKLGFFDNGGAIYHGVYLSNEDIKILKEKDITVVSCPASNMKLASGVAEIKKLLDSNVRIALGTDGAASNNGLDMFREMYLVTGLQKLINKDPVSIPAFEVLKMATVNGAIAMGYDNAKYLVKNQLADIIMIDMSRPSMQPENNIISNLVYAGEKDVVKMTMIDGKILYMDGEFYINENINEIYKKAQQITDELKIIKQ